VKTFSTVKRLCMSTRELTMMETGLSVRSATKSSRNSQVLRSTREFMINNDLIPVKLKVAMKPSLKNQTWSDTTGSTQEIDPSCVRYVKKHFHAMAT
jgi:hypothetical protein